MNDGWTLPPCGHLECADRLHVGCESTRAEWELWRHELEDVEDAEELAQYLEDGA